MCGRISAYDPSTLEAFLRMFRVNPPTIPPRYNVSPTTDVPALWRDEEGHHAELMAWGLTPRFWRGGTPKPLFNARAEGIWERANFRGRIGKHHCVVLANGFYEWRQGAQGKEPWHITRADGQALAFAGIWQEGLDHLECCIVTTGANAMMAEIHDRMPVILDVETSGAWLEATDREEINALMAPCPAGWLTARRVSSYVNSSRHEGVKCLAEPDAA